MSRPTVRSLLSRALRAIDRVAPPRTVHAHCDIPCGIYDPHYMLVGALTVVRMNQLIEAYYPGTRLGISEWNFGADETMNGALAIADVLGMSEGAVNVAAHRLRRRFGEALREQIAQTLASTDEVDDEIAQLKVILSRDGA